VQDVSPEEWRRRKPHAADVDAVSAHS